MIDLFMTYVDLCNKYRSAKQSFFKDIKSLRDINKVYYQIMRETRSKTTFSTQDLLEYSWIIKYLQKFFELEDLPIEGVHIVNGDTVCKFHIMTKDPIVISVSCNNKQEEFEVYCGYIDKSTNTQTKDINSILNGTVFKVLHGYIVELLKLLLSDLQKRRKT